MTWEGGPGGLAEQTLTWQGTKLGGELQLASVNSGEFLHVTSLTSGKFVAVWKAGGVRGQIFDNFGGAVGNQIALTTSGSPVGFRCPEVWSGLTLQPFTGNQMAEPVVAALPDGRYVFAWLRAGSMYVRLLKADGAFDGDEIKPYSGPGLKSTPDLAALKDGGFVVVWASEQDGWGRGTYVQRFDSNGKRIYH